MAGVDYTARALKESFMLGYNEEGLPVNVVQGLNQVGNGLLAIAKSLDAVAEAITNLDEVDHDAIIKGITDVKKKQEKIGDAMGLREFYPHGF